MFFNSTADIVTKLQETFPKILFIVNYGEGKEDFTKKFIQICFNKAGENVTNRLTEEQKKELSRIQPNVNNTPSPQQLEEMKRIAGINNEELAQIIFASVNATLDDYIKTIIPTLTPSQKTELEAYLSTI